MAKASKAPRRWWWHFTARPRLVLSLVLGAAIFGLTPPDWVAHTGTRFLIGWNAASLVYLALALHMMVGSNTERIRTRALREQDGRSVVLVLVVAAAVAVLYAIGTQLSMVKDLHGLQRTGHVALAALTVVTSWLFTQTMFALQYAHDFYLVRLRKQPDPLSFPGTADPVYGDFMYFSSIIGTSAQTADVSFTGGTLRRIGLLHCVLAFFFNTTVLALTINIAAGLF